MAYNCAKTPLVYLLILFISGIISAGCFLTLEFSLFAVAILFLTYFFPFINRYRWFILATCVVFCGALRYHAVQTILPENHLSSFEYKAVRGISGVVIKAQLQRDGRNKYLIQCDSVLIENKWSNASGSVQINTRRVKKMMKYGEKIRIHGSITRPMNKRNPGAFDYREYLARQHIYYLMYINDEDSATTIGYDGGNWFIRNVVIPLKSYCVSGFNTYLSENAHALLQALLLGEKQDLERAVIEKFQRVGVVHVLAISGLHVGYVVLFVFTAFSFFGFSPKLRIIGLSLVLMIYIVLVEFKAPVMRASLMALLYYYGRIIERKSTAGNLLAGAALIILIIDPTELYNPGFQFSFAAVISIIYGYRKLHQSLPLPSLFNKNKYFVNLLWNPLLVSVSAVVGTAPLTMFYYGTFTVAAVAANLFVIPLIGLLVLLGFFLLIFIGISDFITIGIGQLIALIYQLLQWITGAFDRLPFAAIDVSRPSVFIMLLMILGVVLFFNLKERIYTIMFAGWLIIFLALNLITLPASDKLEVIFMDVGQGDATYLRFPNNNIMLVDGGDASIHWDNGLKTLLPFLKYQDSKRITYLVGSHAHDDHIGGFISLVDRVTIDTVILSHYQFKSQNYQELVQKCAQYRIPIRHVKKGDQLYPDSNCRVYVMHPDSLHAIYHSGSGAECNNSSLVLKIQYGDNGILLTGDLEMEAEPVLYYYDHFLESEILKVGHHGSKTSTSQTLLDLVQPLLAVVPVAAKNTFRHPSPQTIKRLKSMEIRTYLTSQMGAVKLMIDPQKIRLCNWR